MKLRTVVITVLTSLVVILFAVITGLTVNRTTLTPSAGLSQEEAIQFALQYAKQGDMYGRLIGEPTEIQIKRMPLGAAFTLTHGSNSRLQNGELASNIGWLVVFKGKVSVVIPSSPTTPEENLVYPQMSVLIHGQTGELISMVSYSQEDEIDPSLLPSVTVPLK